MFSANLPIWAQELNPTLSDKKTAFFYTDAYTGYAYSDYHPLKPYRLKLTYELIKAYGLLDLPETQLLKPEKVSRKELERIHTANYLDVLEDADKGTEKQEYHAYGLGTGDNPVFPGVYQWSALTTGGSLQAARLVKEKKAGVAFNIAGGLHHAMRNRASGFCYINDPAIAIAWLMDQGYRTAYIDIDVHHGDGVQAAFYETDQVLTIDLHESGVFRFPGSGFEMEIGEGKGKGFSVNLPFLARADDEIYWYGFSQIVPPLLKAYKPDFVVTQLGVDSFHDDPLATMMLTTNGFSKVVGQIKELAPRWIALGGGGYNLGNVARAWTIAWAIMNGIQLDDSLPASVFPALQGIGYKETTLRDPEIKTTAADRDKILKTLDKSINYLKETVFPIVGAS
jgi:acetoin utilization protein AcuC